MLMVFIEFDEVAVKSLPIKNQTLSLIDVKMSLEKST